MIIETTINLEKTKREQIKAAAETMGASQSLVILLLIRKLLEHHEQFAARNRAIRYQERRPAHKWKKTHLSLLFRDYEYFLDLKKVCKCSGSFLIAFAVDNYLDDILNNKCDNKKYIEDTDNYPQYYPNQYGNYIMQKETVGKIVCWKLYWGYPAKTTHLFPEN